MNQLAWGPPTWKVMFYVAANYMEEYNPRNRQHQEKRQMYEAFYHFFVRVLPCKYCRLYSLKVLEERYPLDYSSRLALMRGLYEWKNHVNMKLWIQKHTGQKKSCNHDKMADQVETMLYGGGQIVVSSAGKKSTPRRRAIPPMPKPTFAQVCRYYEAARVSATNV